MPNYIRTIYGMVLDFESIIREDPSLNSLKRLYCIAIQHAFQSSRNPCQLPVTNIFETLEKQ